MNAQDRATAKYKAKNIKRYTLEINKVTESELYDELEAQPNKAKYLKDLIRNNIRSK